MSTLQDDGVSLRRLNEELAYLPKFPSLSEIPRLEHVITKIDWTEFQRLPLPTQWGILYAASRDFENALLSFAAVMKRKNWEFHKFPIDYVRPISALLESLLLRRHSSEEVFHVNWHLSLLYFDSLYYEKLGESVLRFTGQNLPIHVQEQIANANWQMGSRVMLDDNGEKKEYVLTFAHSSLGIVGSVTPQTVILVSHTRFDFS